MPKEPKQHETSGASRLTDGLISQEAMKAIVAHTGVIYNGLMQGGVSKATANKKVDQIALIVAAELDVADGSPDKVIHRETLVRKFEKLSHNPEFKKLMGGKSTDEMLAQFSKRVGEIPETITLDELTAKLAKPMHKIVSKAFAGLDSDKNDVITTSELNAALPMPAQTAKAGHSK